MPLQIEHEGQNITVYTKDELDKEVAGLKITNQQLKDEKKELADKLADSKAAYSDLEEAKAKAEGDNETLKRLADEKESRERQKYEDQLKRNADLINTIKKERIDNQLNDLINKVGAGGDKNLDLRDLLKTRYQYDFDIESGVVSVLGDGVTSIADLERVVKEGERYAAYRAGSGASGGGAAGGSASGAGVKNPFQKGENFNLTEQARLLKNDPALAAQLKAAAV